MRVIGAVSKTDTVEEVSGSDPKKKEECNFNSKTKKKLFSDAVNAMTDMVRVVESNSADLSDAVWNQNGIFKEDVDDNNSLREQQRDSLKA